LDTEPFRDGIQIVRRGAEPLSNLDGRELAVAIGGSRILLLSQKLLESLLPLR
jgi:hypothetical protein